MNDLKTTLEKIDYSKSIWRKVLNPDDDFLGQFERVIIEKFYTFDPIQSPSFGGKRAERQPNMILPLCKKIGYDHEVWNTFINVIDFNDSNDDKMIKRLLEDADNLAKEIAKVALAETDSINNRYYEEFYNALVCGSKKTCFIPEIIVVSGEFFAYSAQRAIYATVNDNTIFITVGDDTRNIDGYDMTEAEMIAVKMISSGISPETIFPMVGMADRNEAMKLIAEIADLFPKPPGRATRLQWIAPDFQGLRLKWDLKDYLSDEIHFISVVADSLMVDIDNYSQSASGLRFIIREHLNIFQKLYYM